MINLNFNIAKLINKFISSGKDNNLNKLDYIMKLILLVLLLSIASS